MILIERIREWIAELATLPTGSLIQRGNSIGYQYYDHGDKRWNDVTDNPVLQNQIIRARELEGLLMPELEVLKSTDKKKRDMIRNYLEEERRRVLAEYIRRLKPYPEHHTIYTPHGDFVTSKSELSLSMLLDMLGVKYLYEKPLHLGEKIVYPDFTFSINGKEYYWEHMGRMHEQKYKESVDWKKQLYARFGIFVGDRLFCTYEYDENFDIVKIKNDFLKFIGSKM